jgi:hypothetical protein
MTRSFAVATELQLKGIDSALSMSKLRKIKLGSVWVTYQFKYAHLELAPILRIPSVSSFAADDISTMTSSQAFFLSDWTEVNKEGSIGNDGILLHEGAFSTKHLIINEGSVSVKPLAEFLRRFHYLERLDYSTGCRSSEDNHIEFSPPSLMAGLQHLKGSLSHLTLIDRYRSFVPNEKSRGYPLGPLKDFQRLEFIDVSASILLGSRDSDENPLYQPPTTVEEILPRALKHLRLRPGDPCDAMKHKHRIVEIIAKKSASFPHLKTINLGWEMVKSPGRDARLQQHIGFTRLETEKLCSQCEQSGVDMVSLSSVCLSLIYQGNLENLFGPPLLKTTMLILQVQILRPVTLPAPNQVSSHSPLPGDPDDDAFLPSAHNFS